MRYGSPESHEITCSKCGKKATVPFKPTEGRAVYCQECFKVERQNRRPF
ncbi:hypothetical protein HY637_04565 [Candidatus Woesearchaeota archaeon]|nr:hypothetical protein [Candidatus Woesearchaeota archaeon]